MFKIGDYVTRKKYGNDVIFKIIKIENNIVYLKGVDVRLVANSLVDDLEKCKYCKKKEEFNINRNLETNKYFYIPGSILHIDTDKEYLEKCEEYYKSQKIKYKGYCYDILDYEKNVLELIEKHNPKIVVITGHDAYYKEKNKYLNSKYYIKTVEKIRRIYKNHSDLIIISGACQSNYEGLILAGSSFASSPAHSNIHALDPAIIAVNLSLSSNTSTIDIDKILNETKYGSAGFGGLIIYGTMNKGYPRKGKN